MGIPWVKVNFIGAQQTAKSLRKIAAFFGDAGLTQRVEAVIAEEMAKVDPVRTRIEARCRGKTAMLFVGGSRAHHYQHLFNEIGMTTLAAGYEFGHRDDYEGRKVLGSIQVDADSRNIEELKVSRHDPSFTEGRSPAASERLTQATGEGFGDYVGMMPETPAGALVVDDISEHEFDRLMALWKPDLVCCGIKEKYGIQKRGVPSKQLHSYDYGGPYAGFAGAIIFYDEIDRLVNSRVWSLVTAPWDRPTAAVPIDATLATA